ncbi:MAG: AI-2E family transporter [Oscillospiraceae bacterium]|nr:AI-2E family transporter [Oscillospiraceae bacterium]
MNDVESYNRDRASVMSMIKFILIVGITVCIGYFARIVVVILVPFLIGFMLAKTANLIAAPVSKLFDKTPQNIKPGRKKSTRTKTALVCYVILNVVLVIFIIFLFVGLLWQANTVLNRLTKASMSFNPGSSFDRAILYRFSVANGGFLTDELIETIAQNIEGVGQNIVAAIPTFIRSSLSAIWKLIGNLPYAIFFVISIMLSGFYFINDGPAVLKFFAKNTPNRKFRNRVFGLINDLSMTVFRVLGGYMALFVITALEAYFVFMAAGVYNYALILALITALIDFMPVLGISATMIPCIIWLVLNGKIINAVIIVIGMAIMTVVRRFIEPPILGKSMHLHPLITLVAMAAGVYLWGAIGFLLGPAFAIIIIQTIKVFEIDKKVGEYLSGVFERFFAPKDGGKADSGGGKKDGKAAVTVTEQETN